MCNINQITILRFDFNTIVKLVTNVGVIQAVKTAEVDPSKGQCVSITKYAVRSMMEPIGGQPHTGRQQPQLREYSEVDLIGPGFQSTAGLTLQPGQKVFVTFTGREVAGHVTKHRPDVDEVHITLQASNAVILIYFVFLLFLRNCSSVFK